MGQQIEELAQFVATTQWEDIPEPVRRHAKLTLLDTLGVILAGGERPEMHQLRERRAAPSGSGATVYASGWPAQDPRTAALLNGIAGRSIELCEGLRLVSGQAALQVLPGVLAVGEQAGSSGREILAAFVVGYDVAGRLASGFTPRPLAHQNGQVSLLAAAAAGARLRGLDAAGISRAMRIATVLVLALAGFEAQPDAIEEALSQLVGGGFDAAHVANELGTSWHITRNYFRLYACCNPVHPALDCLAAALAELRPHPEQLDRIEVATYRFASVMRNPDPPNYFASKYSLPHAAAAMVVRGGAGFAMLDDKALDDCAIRELRHRVHVAEDAAMSAVAPRMRPARVTVTLTDGRRSTQARESHRGDFQQPFAESEIREKFRELAGVVLTQEGTRHVEHAVDRCEHWKSVDDLTGLLRRYGRP